MEILGVGIVFSGGKGIAAYEKALVDGWIPPTYGEARAAAHRRFPRYEVNLDGEADGMILRQMRRADRFSRMSALAAAHAMADSGLEIADPSRVGIILASAFGPHVTTFRFLDDVIDYGEASVSPIVFSHTVHNAAVSYISKLLTIRGPIMTVTQFYFSFHQALMLADAWLAEGRCDALLVGATDECGEVMAYIAERTVLISETGKIVPFEFSATPKTVPGEGSVFFACTRNGAGRRYARVASRSPDTDDDAVRACDLLLVDADGMAADESTYVHGIPDGAWLASYTPCVGALMTGSAFSCAAAALMLKRQMVYASPVPDNPHGLNVCCETRATRLARLCCLKYNCSGVRSTILLER